MDKSKYAKTAMVAEKWNRLKKLLINEHRKGEFEMKSINELITEAYKTATSKGWHDQPTAFGEQLANIHAELSEAWEEYRNGCDKEKIYFKSDKPCGIAA